MVNGWLMDGLWMVYGWFMDGLWMVYGWFMDGLWMVYGWFMDGLWMVYGWFMDGLWMVYGKSHKIIHINPWLIQKGAYPHPTPILPTWKPPSRHGSEAMEAMGKSSKSRAHAGLFPQR